MALSATITPTAVAATNPVAQSSIGGVADAFNWAPAAFALKGGDPVFPADVQWSYNYAVAAGAVQAIDLRALPRVGGGTWSVGHVKWFGVWNALSNAGQSLYLDGGTNAWTAPWPCAAGLAAGNHIEEVPPLVPLEKPNVISGWAVDSTHYAIYISNPTGVSAAVTVAVLGTVA
jgi:hypothetical protein